MQSGRVRGGGGGGGGVCVCVSRGLELKLRDLVDLNVNKYNICA